MTPARISEVARQAVDRHRAPSTHAHRMALREAFRMIPAGAAARLIVDALDDAYGPEIGRAVAGCVSDRLAEKEGEA